MYISQYSTHRCTRGYQEVCRLASINQNFFNKIHVHQWNFKYFFDITSTLQNKMWYTCPICEWIIDFSICKQRYIRSSGATVHITSMLVPTRNEFPSDHQFLNTVIHYWYLKRNLSFQNYCSSTKTYIHESFGNRTSRPADHSAQDQSDLISGLLGSCDRTTRTVWLQHLDHFWINLIRINLVCYLLICDHTSSVWHIHI